MPRRGLQPRNSKSVRSYFVIIIETNLWVAITERPARGTVTQNGMPHLSSDMPHSQRNLTHVLRASVILYLDWHFCPELLTQFFSYN